MYDVRGMRAEVRSFKEKFPFIDLDGKFFVSKEKNQQGLLLSRKSANFATQKEECIALKCAEQDEEGRTNTALKCAERNEEETGTKKNQIKEEMRG